MKLLVIVVGGLAALTSAAPALAQGLAVRTSHDAIARGDWAKAERVLVAEQRIFPDRAEVMLNLAAVYASTGRPALARSTYRDVLSRADVMMDRADGSVVSAHSVAQKGLARLAPERTAAR